MYKLAKSVSFGHQRRPTLPGTAEWLGQQQTRRQRPRVSKQDRELMKRLDEEARVAQAQRGARSVLPIARSSAQSAPPPAGLRRSPMRRSPTD